MSNTSYKEMLRNRIPTELDLTLRFCKVKTKWVDYVYSQFIQVFAEKKDRDHVIRLILKKHIMPDPYGTYRERFDFNGCINWCDISEDDEECWKNISGWYDWFNHYIPTIETTTTEGYSKETAIQICTSDIEDYEVRTKLITFLIQNI